MPPFTVEQDTEFNRILEEEPGTSPDVAADRAIDMFTPSASEPVQQIPDQVTQEFNRILEEEPDADPDIAAELAIDMFNPFRFEEEEAPESALSGVSELPQVEEGEVPVVPTPEEEVEKGSALVDIGRAFVRGGLRVSSTSLGTLTALERTLAEDQTQDFTQTLLGQSLTDVEDQIKRFEGKRKKGGVAFAGTVIENLIPSIVIGLAGAGAARFATPAALGLASRIGLKTLARSPFAAKFAKTIAQSAGFVGARSLPFGASEFESASREVEEQIKSNPNLTAQQKIDLDREKSTIAGKSALAEVAFEGLGSIIELGSGGVSKAFPTVFRIFSRKAGGTLAGRTLKGTVAESIASKTGTAAIASLGEAATEGATGFTQAGIREKAGLPTISKGQATLEGASLGAVSALFFRGALQTVSDINRKKLQKAIESPATDPAIRKTAVHFAAEKLRAENLNDPQTVGLVNSMQLFLNDEIDQGKDIKLDVDLKDIGNQAQIAEFQERQVQSTLKETVDKLVSGEFTVEQVAEQAETIPNLPGIQSRLKGIVEIFRGDDVQKQVTAQDKDIIQKQVLAEEVKVNIRADKQAAAISEIAEDILTEGSQTLTLEEKASIQTEAPLLPSQRRVERAVQEEIQGREALGQTQEDLANTIIDRNVERFLATTEDITEQAEPQREKPKAGEPAKEVSKAKVTEGKAAATKPVGVAIPTKETGKAPIETKQEPATKTTEVAPDERSIQEVRTEAEQLGASSKGPKQAIVKRINRAKAAQKVLQAETPESLGKKTATQVRQLAKNLNIESTGDIANVRNQLQETLQTQTQAVAAGTGGVARRATAPKVKPVGSEVAKAAGVVRPVLQPGATVPTTTIPGQSLKVNTEGLSPEQATFVNEPQADIGTKITAELRTQLEGLGLNSGGRRADLVGRLTEAKDEILGRQGLRVDEESGKIVEDRPLTKEEFDQDEDFGDLDAVDQEALKGLDEEVTQDQTASRTLEDDISTEPKQVGDIEVEQATFGAEEQSKGMDDKQLKKLQSKPKTESKKVKKPKTKPVEKTTPRQDLEEKVKICE